jgi:hypothetical protein
MSWFHMCPNRQMDNITLDSGVICDCGRDEKGDIHLFERYQGELENRLGVRDEQSSKIR